MVDEIRYRIGQNLFEFSLHATNQSIIRSIHVPEVREMISNAEIIEEYPDDKYGPSVLMLGFTNPTAPSTFT